MTSTAMGEPAHSFPWESLVVTWALVVDWKHWKKVRPFLLEVMLAWAHLRAVSYSSRHLKIDSCAMSQQSAEMETATVQVVPMLAKRVKQIPQAWQTWCLCPTSPTTREAD